MKQQINETLDGLKTEYNVAYRKDNPIALVLFNGAIWVLSELNSRKFYTFNTESEAFSALALISDSNVSKSRWEPRTSYQIISRKNVPCAQIIYNGALWLVSELNSRKVQAFDNESEAQSAVFLLKGSGGRFYTENSQGNNPFNHPAFFRWANEASMSSTTLLEPFAGRNSIVDTLQSMGLCANFKSFDIQPGRNDVIRRDTIANFPEGYQVCVSNPPWLARNVATRYGLEFPRGTFQDLYQVCLRKCLSYCDWVALLVPESFIRTELFRERLSMFISLTFETFRETTHPVALALFQKEKTEATEVWSGSQFIGYLSDIEAMKPELQVNGAEVKFNDPGGNVGLLALDNTREASIRFCDPDELGDYRVRQSCRAITKVRVPRPQIVEWNKFLTKFRAKTCDVLLTAYRGLRADGKYRRRLDYDLARRIIQNV